MSKKVIDWESEAARTLKAQLKLRGLTYESLARLLLGNELDENLTASSVSRRIARGTFSYAFFLRCMYLMKKHAPMASD